jgi:hypothetical protein
LLKTFDVGEPPPPPRVSYIDPGLRVLASPFCPPWVKLSNSVNKVTDTLRGLRL